MRALVLLVALPGCRQILNLDDLEPRSDAMNLDAALAEAGIDTPPDTPPCPADYTFSGNSRYRVVTEATNWLLAEADCEDDGYGTHLVVIRDAAESATVASLAAGLVEPWLGISDRRVENEWRLVTGDVATYTDWSAMPAQQPNGATAQNCVDLFMDGNWHDDTCTIDQPYICECDGVPADPAAY